MVYPLSNGNIIAGGYYDTTGESFSSFSLYGQTGSFLTIFEPQTTGIKPLVNLNDEINIYPNPANEYLTIEVEKKGNFSVLIGDIIGNVIYKEGFNGKLQIKIKYWPKGIYFIQMISENGYKTVKKLIVE